jgi:hypothetical protein
MNAIKKFGWLTLWIAVLSYLAGAGGALTALLDVFGKAAYVSYILAGAGAVGTLTVQLLHILNILTPPLSAGAIRLLTTINGVVGTAYIFLGGIASALPPVGLLGRAAPMVIAVVGFIQVFTAGVLQQLDANVSAKRIKAAAAASMR